MKRVEMRRRIRFIFQNLSHISLNTFRSIFLSSDPNKSLNLLRKSLYAVMAYIMIFMTLPNAPTYWGVNSIIMRDWEWGSSFMAKFQYLMMNEWLDNLWPVLVFVHLSALVFAFLGKYLKLNHILIFVTTVWLYHRMTLYVIGGNLLLISLLFYLIFANEKKKDLFQLKLNQLILLACQIQICFVYFFSGIWKLAGEEWLNGQALHYILHIEEFSHPWIIDNLANKKWITIPSTYFSLSYLLLFPVLVWIKKIKKPLLLLGLVLHVCIGLMMGIWDFSLIMIASYMAFWDTTAINSPL